MKRKTAMYFKNHPVLSTRMEIELFRMIDREAKRKKISRNRCVVDILRDYFKQPEQE